MSDETKQVSIITTAVVIVVSVIAFNVRECGQVTELRSTEMQEKVLSDCIDHGHDPLSCKAMMQNR